MGHIGPYGERRARVYNGGLGAVPPARSRAEPLVRELGAMPPEAEHFFVVICLKWRKAAILLAVLYRDFYCGGLKPPRCRDKEPKA